MGLCFKHRMLARQSCMLVYVLLAVDDVACCASLMVSVSRHGFVLEVRKILPTHPPQILFAPGRNTPSGSSPTFRTRFRPTAQRGPEQGEQNVLPRSLASLWPCLPRIRPSLSLHALRDSSSNHRPAGP